MNTERHMVTTTQILDKYLSDEQLAPKYKVSPRTIKRWRREGKAPPSILIGNKRHTHVDDANAQIEALRQAALDDAKRRAR